MPQFYLNNRPIPQGVAINHLANAMPQIDFKQVKDLIYLAKQGYRFPMQKIAEYGLHIGGENDCGR